MKKLRDALAAFDGQATTLLGEAEAQYFRETGYLDALISFFRDQDGMVQSGATWLLRSALDKGQALSAIQTARVCEDAKHLTEWSAQLHVCQSVHRLDPRLNDAEQLAAWLERLMDHRRPFLRAWSLDAFCALAVQYQEFRPSAKNALEKANADPAASVRARARNIRLN